VAVELGLLALGERLAGLDLRNVLDLILAVDADQREGIRLEVTIAERQRSMTGRDRRVGPMVEGHGGGEVNHGVTSGSRRRSVLRSQREPGDREDQHGADVDGELARARPLGAKAV